MKPGWYYFSSISSAFQHCFKRADGSCDTCSLARVFTKLGFWSPCDLQDQRKEYSLSSSLCRCKLIAINKCTLMHMEHVSSWPDFSSLLNINTLTLLQNINLICKFIFLFYLCLVGKAMHCLSHSGIFASRSTHLLLRCQLETVFQALRSARGVRGNAEVFISFLFIYLKKFCQNFQPVFKNRAPVTFYLCPESQLGTAAALMPAANCKPPVDLELACCIIPANASEITKWSLCSKKRLL